MRISREQMFMEIAETVAKRSTCLRNNVGAVLVDDTFGHNIVAIGYNGLSPNADHCTLKTCCGKGCSKVIHAEVNAIARGDMQYDCRYSLYVTVSPCLNCSNEIIRSSYISKVFYRYPYRDLSGIMNLIQHGIEVYKILPSGEIIGEEEEWNGK